ncbi:hypothetical protein DL770_007801 [Monosporascus sp. CRB-9-2]|nr:hypothetical protein DL770_007801 [Monosporascus sp. CRB-9-2]
MSRRLRPRARISPYVLRKKRLEKYFEGDAEKRFQLENRHGKGGQASVYKVKYTRPGYRSAIPRFLVLKLADPEKKSDVEGLRKEKAILQRLQGCKHIARMRNTTNDPLASAADELGWAWIYLDLLENGTLRTFMERSKAAGLNSLPNRLLWRIFLCMVRSCIGMAWPRRADNDNETTMRQLPTSTGITHNDIHGDNFMFGPYLDNPEHDISPILKLLDFGQSEVWGNIRHDSGATAEQWNIEDIGLVREKTPPSTKSYARIPIARHPRDDWRALTEEQMMASVVLLETDKRYTGEEIEVDLSQFGRSNDVLSPASGILPDAGSREMDQSLDPCPHIDLDLRHIVASCMAEDPKQRPTLAELEEWVYTRVCNDYPVRYGAMPRGMGWEMDKTIQTIVKAGTFDAGESSEVDC